VYGLDVNTDNVSDESLVHSEPLVVTKDLRNSECHLSDLKTSRSSNHKTLKLYHCTCPLLLSWLPDCLLFVWATFMETSTSDGQGRTIKLPLPTRCSSMLVFTAHSSWKEYSYTSKFCCVFFPLQHL